jgi:hypothetical protein
LNCLPPGLKLFHPTIIRRDLAGPSKSRQSVLWSVL